MNNEYFMQIALKEAQKALRCGEFPVGCLLAHQDTIIAVGSRKGTTGRVNNEIDHAEIQALRQLSDLSTGINPAEITVYCTLEPCLMCFGAILIAGIRHIVYAYEDVMGGGTGCDVSSLPTLYTQHEIAVVPGVLRHESITLFKTFFSNPANTYWKESLLESYTLSQ